MTLEKGWRDHCIPLFVHGDGVEFQSRDTLLCFSWGSLLGKGNLLENHLLLAAFPKLATSAETWPPIWKILRWSFDALGKGVHPTHDHNGKPLEKGSAFYQDRGKPLYLGKGYKGILWSIIGDHDLFGNVLFPPHWSSHHPCWECDAENFEGANPWKRYKEISLEKLNLGVYSHQEQLDDPWSDHAIFRLPHVSPCMVRGDPLHILFCKGL